MTDKIESLKREFGIYAKSFTLNIVGVDYECLKTSLVRAHIKYCPKKIKIKSWINVVTFGLLGSVKEKVVQKEEHGLYFELPKANNANDWLQVNNEADSDFCVITSKYLFSTCKVISYKKTKKGFEYWCVYKKQENI